MPDILLPVGRLIGGDVSRLNPRIDDATKQPKVRSDGTPDKAVNFGVAIPKEPGHTHWSQSTWGAQIFEIGKAAYPREHAARSFAWKVIDGDSAEANKRGNVPRDQEGYPGHWVLWFSQGWAPKLVSADGSHEIPAESFVCGYYVRVLASVKGNNPSPSPGVYLNPLAVALIGEGDRIETSTPVDTSVFAASPASLPPGARPITAAAPEFAAPAAAPAPAVAPPPDPSFMAPPPAAPAHRMTAKATATYDQYRAAGWTDEQLVAHGMMEA